MKGYTPSTIARSLPADSGLSDRNIREHFLRQHLPLDDAVVVRLVEEAHQRRDDVVNTGADSVIRTLGLSVLVRNEVERKLEAGELSPTVKDGLAAEAIIAKFETLSRTAIDQDTMVAGVAAFAAAVKQHCSPEQGLAIMATIRASEDARILQDSDLRKSAGPDC